MKENSHRSAYNVREKILLLLIGVLTSLLGGCNLLTEDGELENVGLILEGTIHDETWGHSAYSGLLEIKDTFNVSVMFEENVTEARQLEKIVSDFDRQGVNLIFGQGEGLGQYFDQIKEYYPHIQFVYFDGTAYDSNITAVQFDHYDSYYYAGMLAAEMTRKNQIGILSPYAETTTLEGFFEGARTVNPQVRIHYKTIGSGYDQQQAMKHYQEMVQKGIDVVFPAGEGFNTPIIHQAKKDGISAIGYINDQYELAKNNVLTSTVIEMEEIYREIAQLLDDRNLTSGIIRLGFENQYVHLGTYGDHVPPSVRNWLDQKMEAYSKTNEK